MIEQLLKSHTSLFAPTASSKVFLPNLKVTDEGPKKHVIVDN